MTGFYWLASYPKSGNTWLRLLLQSCRDGGAPADINAATLGEAVGLDRAVFDEEIGVSASEVGADLVLAWRGAMLRGHGARLFAPLIAKTHEPCIRFRGQDWLHPPEATLGAVHLVRDPRDVAVSLGRHLARPIDEAIAIMGDPDWRMAAAGNRLAPRLASFWSSWSANVESWLAAPFPVTLLRYEEMHADPAAALGRALPALGMSATGEAIQSAIAATRIEILRDQEAARGFREFSGEARFFGQGRSGGWRTILSPGQARTIERDHGATMHRLGYPC